MTGLTAPVARATRFLSKPAWARVAGFMFIFYIVNGIASLATSGAVSEVLSSLVFVDAVVLAVALFALTVDESWWLAVVALVLRATEGFATAYWDPVGGQMLFAAGSSIFAYLFIRGRLVPLPLAWVGLAVSVLLFATLPVTGGSFSNGATWVGYLPMLVYELTLGAWLLVKGVPSRQRREQAA